MPLDISNGVLIGSIPLRSGDEYRVEITEFKRGHWVNIRRWYLSDAGDLRPTRTGINIAVEHLPVLSRLVRRACKRAEAKGLLPKKKGE